MGLDRQFELAWRFAEKGEELFSLKRMRHDRQFEPAWRFADEEEELFIKQPSPEYEKLPWRQHKGFSGQGDYLARC